MKVVLKQMSKYPIHAVASYVACGYEDYDPSGTNDLNNVLTDLVMSHEMHDETSVDEALRRLKSRMIDQSMLDLYGLTIPTVGSYLDYSMKGYLHTPKIKEMLPMDGYPYLKDGIQCGIYMTLGEIRNFLDMYRDVKKHRPGYIVKLMIIFENITGYTPTGKIIETMFINLSDVADNDQISNEANGAMAGDISSNLTGLYRVYPVNQNEGDLTDDDHVMFIPLIADQMEAFETEKYGLMASGVNIAYPSTMERGIFLWDYVG